MIKYLGQVIVLATIAIRLLTIYENIQKRDKDSKKSNTKKQHFTFDDFETDENEKSNEKSLN